MQDSFVSRELVHFGGGLNSDRKSYFFSTEWTKGEIIMKLHGRFSSHSCSRKVRYRGVKALLPGMGLLLVLWVTNVFEICPGAGEWEVCFWFQPVDQMCLCDGYLHMKILAPPYQPANIFMTQSDKWGTGGGYGNYGYNVKGEPPTFLYAIWWPVVCDCSCEHTRNVYIHYTSVRATNGIRSRLFVPMRHQWQGGKGVKGNRDRFGASVWKSN